MDEIQWTPLTPATLDQLVKTAVEFFLGKGFDTQIWTCQKPTWKSGPIYRRAIRADDIKVELPATGGRDRVYRVVSFAGRITVFCYQDTEPQFRHYWRLAEDALSFRLYRKNELMSEYRFTQGVTEY